MKRKDFDVLIIGGGSAGMAAAAEVTREGYSAALIERDGFLGGILNQCIHNGFGLHRFKEELTGPEYAERYVHILKEQKIEYFFGMTVTEIDTAEEKKRVFGFSAVYGMVEFSVRAVILSMGCRERNRGNIGTPGTRPSGVFTAGLAQRLVNIDGYIPGRTCVIVGSGDIGLIMARRMTWIGAEVKGVVEIQPYPAGLTRNIVQCLNDFSIPLYLSHVISRIHGKDRVTGVDVTPLDNGMEVKEKSFHIPCDTLLLSVGLIPDNEISKKCGIDLNPETGGPYVDANLMTSVEGIFACGNVLHVHDLVDFVSEESSRCGRFVSEYLRAKLKGKNKQQQYPVTAGSNIKYVVPNTYIPERENKFFLRSMVVGNNVELLLKINGEEIRRKKLKHVQPSEMISFSLKEDDCSSIEKYKENTLEAHILVN
jgi:thioredoxin reductase